MHPPARFAVLALAACLAFAPAAQAEKADRNKPIVIEGGNCEGNFDTNHHVCKGDITVTQGTFILHTQNLVSGQDAEGYIHLTANGGKDGLSRFRQKKDGKDEYTEGEAERMDYDERTSLTRLTSRAHLHSGEQESIGPCVTYNSYTEVYSQNDTCVAGTGTTGPRTIIINPRKHPEEPAASAPAGKP